MLITKNKKGEETRGAFPEQRRNSLINHHSTMHCFGNELASHDCFLFPVIVIYLMFDSSWFPSYVILRGSLAHAHFSKTALTMDAQKYIIKMHFTFR